MDFPSSPSPPVMKTFSNFGMLFAALVFAANSFADVPSISFTPANCTATTPISINATITDSNGINIATGFKPRLYYKKKSENNSLAATNDNLSNGWKYVEATNSSSPFQLDFDFAKLTSAPTATDSIEYFIIAEDSVGEAGWNTVSFAVLPSSVVLTGAQFPVSGVTNFFRTIKTYSGNLTIDPLGVANDTNFLSLTKSNGLFDAINNGALKGNVTVSIHQSLDNENGAVALNEWIEYNGCTVKDSATYRLRIKPYTTGIEIKGKSAGAIIKLNGADRVTIDGRTATTTSERSFTIKNDSAANNSAVIHLASNGTNNGCQFDTIRYCNISGGSPQNTTSHITFGVYSNKDLTTPEANQGWGNHHNSFEKNYVQRVRYGIVLAGSNNYLNQSNSILANTIGPDVEGINAIGAAGIVLANQQNTIVRANEVKYVGGDIFNISDTADRAGIYLGSIQENLWNSQMQRSDSAAKFIGVQVDGNTVHHITNQAGLSAIGIAYLNSIDTTATNNQISNNMVYAVLANGNSAQGDHAAGIGVIGGHTDFVVYNSILMNGAYDTDSLAAMTNSPAGIRINSTDLTNPMVSNLTVVNNIVQIDTAAAKAGTDIFAITTASASDIWSAIGCDFNNYYTPGYKVGGVGNTASYSAYSTLSSWKTVFSPNQEPNSIASNPLFKSETDLHITANSPCIETGLELDDLHHDFDGDIRPIKANSTIGADQFGQYYIWVGRENSHTTSDLNWRNYKAPGAAGSDSIDVVIATENYSWTLGGNFTLHSLALLNSTYINLDYNNIYATGDVNMQGYSLIYSGVGTCTQNYNVEEQGALILSAVGHQSFAMDSGELCNLWITADSVTLQKNISIKNDLLAKLTSTRILQGNKTIDVKGDIKIWSELEYDSCTTLNCALINISGPVQQLVDLRLPLTTIGKIASLQVDKNNTGDNSKAMLGANLVIDNFLNLKKGKLISEGSDAESGFRFKTVYIYNPDSNAVTRVNGNTNDAFFQGILYRKIGNAATYLFPIGFEDVVGKHATPNTMYYTPVTLDILDNSSSGNSVIATFYDADPDTANVGLIGKPYGDHSSAIEDGTGNWVDVKGDYLWHVEYSGDSLPYNIQLAAPFMNASNQDELESTPNELRIMKRSSWNSGNWGFQGSHDIASTHFATPDFAQQNSARRTNLKFFSGFGVGGNSGAGQPLPVKLVSLAAKPIDNKFIELSWTTAVEINNAGFEVQRSTDGSNFDAIGWVDGAGNSTASNNYIFNDKNVQAGIRYYYRLYQKDFDGNNDISSVVTAQLKESSAVKWIQLMPNPALNVSSLVANISTQSVATISITDIKGTTVWKHSTNVFAGLNTIPLDISALVAGNYIVSLATENETTSKQLIVK